METNFDMPVRALRALVFLGGMALGTAANADPCTARVAGHRSGEVVTGMIQYVGDGDSLCIGKSRDPSTWIEIRLGDWYAPELHEPGGQRAKRALKRLLGQLAVYTATRGQNGRTVSYDRLVAVCSVKGRSIADHMRSAGIEQGGRGPYPRVSQTKLSGENR